MENGEKKNRIETVAIKGVFSAFSNNRINPLTPKNNVSNISIEKIQISEKVAITTWLSRWRAIEERSSRIFSFPSWTWKNSRALTSFLFIGNILSFDQTKLLTTSNSITSINSSIISLLWTKWLWWSRQTVGSRGNITPKILYSKD